MTLLLTILVTQSELGMDIRLQIKWNCYYSATNYCTLFMWLYLFRAMTNISEIRTRTMSTVTDKGIAMRTLISAPVYQKLRIVIGNCSV